MQEPVQRGKCTCYNKKLVLLEEGLYQEKNKCIKEIERKASCCTRCIPYLRLIFLLQVMLFFGWGCYMVFNIYFPQVTENETTDIVLETYSPISESLSEIQKSRPSNEMPAIFVKPKVIVDKINNLLENIKLTKEENLMQNEAIVTNVAEMEQTNMQKSSNVQNNNIGISNINRFLLPTLSSENLQFLGKLLTVNKIGTNLDLENDFTEDVDHLTLKSEGNYAFNVPYKPKSLEFDVAAVINTDNFVDHMINADLTNTLNHMIIVDLKQEFSDSIKDAAQDNRNENSSFEETDEPANVRQELDLVICPPHDSHESSDASITDSVKDFSASQPVLVVYSKQMENKLNDNIDESNEDKQDVNDNNMMMLASVFGNEDYLDVSTVQNTEEQHSLESIEERRKDEEYELLDSFMQPKVQDSKESLTPTADEFQWFNMPPRFTDFEDISSLVPQDISSDPKIHSFSWDTYEKMDIDDVTPESHCEITINLGILKVQCPAIKFDEKWNLTSPEIPSIDVSKFINLKDLLDDYLPPECDEDASEQLGVENISNDNSDNEVTTSPHSTPGVIKSDLQESTTSMKFLNDALLDSSEAAFIDPFDSREINHDYSFYDLFYDLNEEEVTQVTTLSSSTSELDSSTVDSNKEPNLFFDNSNTQQEQQKISKEQDSSVSDNIELTLKNFEHFYALEKKLISQFKNEMSNILQNLPKNNNNRHNVCNILRDIRNSISQRPLFGQYVILKFLEFIQNPPFDYPHDMDDYYRKKRMVDDLTWQQDPVSNQLEENSENVDLLENLRKIFHKIKILALSIDRLQERYLVRNKLEDYASSEFPNETEERQELYVSKIV